MKLWAHQRAVLLDLVIGSWLLLWDPGTGKTAPLLVASGMVGGHCLWLTPPVLIPQLIEEIRRWRHGATVQVLRNGREVVRDVDIVIVSYDLMRRLPVWRQLYSRRWDVCVCDEGHALGHASSLRTKAFYGARDNSQGALYRKCARVWVSTGTPVLNSPDELHGHLSRLFPHLVPGMSRRADFLGRYCILARKPYGEVVVGGRNLGELREILSACSSRLRLEDVVADLPSLLEDVIPVEISKADREAIEAAIPESTALQLHVVLTQLEGGIEAAWQRLNAMMLPMMSVRRVMALAKAEAAAALVNAELDGGTDRVVLFGMHVDALRHVARACARHHPGLLIGDTPPGQRDGLVRAFNEGRSRLLICGIRVGGVGLNLQAARRCIHLETDWTPAGHQQAVARLYRAGQQRPVHSSILIVPRSIDARVAEVLARKRRTIDAVLGEVA